MPGTDLVRVADERQVRSYHGAFSGELTIYQVGDLRPWRPIPARMIAWVAGLVFGAFLLGQAAGLSLPVWSMGWFLYYLVVPGFLGYLGSRMLVEGRYLHVVLVAWSRHVFCGSHLTGGYYRTRPRALRKTKVKVTAEYRPREPVPLLPVAAAAFIIAVPTSIALAVGLAHHPAHHRATIRPAATAYRATFSLFSPPVLALPQRLPSVPRAVPRKARRVRRATARRAPVPSGRRVVAPQLPAQAIATPYVPVPTYVAPRPQPVLMPGSAVLTVPPVSHRTAAHPDRAPTRRTPRPDPAK